MSERYEGQTPSLRRRTRHAASDVLERHRGRLVEGCIAFLVAIVLASGTYTVENEELAMVTRFGKVIKPEVGPGVRYRFPVIDEAYVHPTDHVLGYRASDGEGGTISFTIPSAGTSVLEVELALRYRIDDLKNYLFAPTDPRELVTMLVREELARVTSRIEPALTSNRNSIQQYLFDIVASRLDSEDVGVKIVSLEIVDVREVKQTLYAFRDMTTERATGTG